MNCLRTFRLLHYFIGLVGLFISGFHLAASEWQLPKPTGPHPIGTNVSWQQVDPHRTLCVQFWYPCSPENNRPRAPYMLEPSLLKALKSHQYLNLEDTILEQWQHVKTHAILDADISSMKKRWPLVILSHGFGMSRINYTNIAQDLASHGYIVAAVDHPDSGTMISQDGTTLGMKPHPNGPEGKVAEIQGDISKLANLLLSDAILKFSGRIDKLRLAAMGHSIGGAAALETGLVDSRFRACIDLDGDPFGKVGQEGVKTPYLIVLHVPEKSHRPPAEMGIQRDQQWKGITSKREVPAIILTIENTNHYSFSDLPFLVPEPRMRKNGATLSPQKTHEITAQAIRTFFNHYLLETETLKNLQDLTKKHKEANLKGYHL